MNPFVGTFISMDSYSGSIDDPVSLHKYLYANANPVMYSDPSGYISQETTNVIEDVSYVIVYFSPVLYAAAEQQKYDETVLKQGILIIKALKAISPLITFGSIFGDQIAAITYELLSDLKNSSEYVKQLRDDALSKAIDTVSKSLTKIFKKIEQDSTHKYWEIDLYKLPISKRMNPVIGRGITKAAAIQRLREGKSVITVFWYNAESISYIAGNGKKPMHHSVEVKDGIIIFGHYHVGNHQNDSHSMYIIGG